MTTVPANVTKEPIKDVEGVKAMLASYQAEQSRLEAQQSQLADRLREIARILEALDLAKRSLEKAGFFTQIAAAEVAAESEIDLDGLTIPQALIKLIERRGGRARVADLRTALEQAKKVKGTHRANYAQIYRALKDRPHLFTKASDEEGVFTLVSQNGSLPNPAFRSR